jgi:sugar phosphate isomerase/epimerase
MGPPELGIKCSLQRCLEIAKGTGFAGIDVDIFEARGLVAAKGANYIVDMFGNAGMKMGGWIWFDHFGFSDDDAAFQQQLAILPSLAGVAQAIGAERALSWILPYSDHLDFGRNFELHVARIRSAMEILNDHGQRLALEYIGPKTFRDGHTHPFISTLQGALELIAAVDRPGAGLIMDSWHWYTSGGTAADIENLPVAMASYVHLSDAPANTPVDSQIDNQRCLPGTTNVIRNDVFLSALHRIGYDGPVTAEPFSEEVNALPAEEAAAVTAEALSRLVGAALSG